MPQYRNFVNNYDELSRLTNSFQILDTVSNSSHSLTNHTYKYGYDLAGNRVSSDDSSLGNNGLTDNTSGYSYDAANHTTFGTFSTSQGGSQTASWGAGYTYDGNGNLKQESVNYGDNNSTSTNYSYDVRNRLVGWTKTPSSGAAQTVSYSYDGANTRTGLTNTAGQNASYLQDVATGGLPLVLQQNSGGYSSYYLYQPGSSTPLFRSGSIARGAGFWSHQDGQGSIRVESDYELTPPNLSDVYAHNFDEPFGASGSQPSQSGDNFLYKGQEYDPNSLYYSQGQYYNPATGRYVQPAGGGGSGNGYANDNPINSLPQGPQCLGCGETLSALLNIVPVVSSAKLLAEAVTGKDVISGADESSVVARGINVGFAFLPYIGEIAKAGSGVLKDAVGLSPAATGWEDFLPQAGDILASSKANYGDFDSAIMMDNENAQGLVGKEVDAETTLIGYHGTSSKFLPAIQENGIQLGKRGLNFRGNDQLGLGFYVTPNIDAADYFAINAARRNGGEPVTLEIWAQNFDTMTGRAVPKNHWWRIRPDSPYVTNSDYLGSLISSFERKSWYQIKFNPKTQPTYKFASLKIGRVLDPTDDVDDITNIIELIKGLRSR